MRTVSCEPNGDLSASDMPAIVALRFNPALRTVADRLSNVGKHKRLIIGPIMRKLLVLAYGILRSGRRFDANYA